MPDFRYRHFIYLDSDEILNIAAIMEGGEVSEELLTLTKGLGGNIGAKFGFAAQGATLGFQGDRRFTKEWKLRRTAYVAADRVLAKLAPKNMGPVSVSSVSENAVIRCDIDLHPLLSSSYEDQPHTDVIQLIRPRWQKLLNWTDPTIKARKQAVRKYGSRQTMQVNMFGSDGNRLAEAKLLLILDPRWVLNPGEFSRRATIVGQVIGVKRPGEELFPRRDSYGPWFEFRPSSTVASSSQPIANRSAPEVDEPRMDESKVSEKNQPGTEVSPPYVPPEAIQLQASEEPSQDVPHAKKRKKLRLWPFGDKGNRNKAEVAAAAASAHAAAVVTNVDRGRHPDGDNEEAWQVSLVLRPIVIFK